MTTSLPTLNGTTIHVEAASIHVPSEGNTWGTSGTLYVGDPERISDYLANPVGELDVHGVMHHINLRHKDGIFTLTIDFPSEPLGVAVFNGLTARELIFALADTDPI